MKKTTKTRPPPGWDVGLGSRGRNPWPSRDNKRRLPARGTTSSPRAGASMGRRRGTARPVSNAEVGRPREVPTGRFPPPTQTPLNREDHPGNKEGVNGERDTSRKKELFSTNAADFLSLFRPADTHHFNCPISTLSPVSVPRTRGMNSMISNRFQRQTLSLSLIQ
ncbi:hypothetical protein SKAU_G00140470 [Synaphobranchus kaupii]|uniref:Uncharacterized protein n=1 Tax=Synaphobranchus kaupii TaxID=118154 RepID=A0A9Q1FS60_SYNKA|nr:hypothetical protein SKAU_G00140470 [Synaphobranchus kaupii]